MYILHSIILNIIMYVIKLNIVARAQIENWDFNSDVVIIESDDTLLYVLCLHTPYVEFLKVHVHVHVHAWKYMCIAH